MNTDSTLAIINPSNAIATRTYKHSETRTYGGALKFKAFCEAEGLTSDNSTHDERVKKHSAHCNETNGNGRLLVTRMEDTNGLVFDKVSVNTDKEGVKRMSVSYVRKSIPKEKISKTAKLGNRVSSASASAQARIEAILAEEEAKTIDIS